jgi:zinc D-Ala-D-Ala carboxypeptidase
MLSRMRSYHLSVAALVLFASCMPASSKDVVPAPPPDPLALYRPALRGLPPEIAKRAEANPDRFAALVERARAVADPWLLVRVDKEKALPDGFAPPDLVSLTDYPFALSRKDLRLRKPVAEAAREMVAAAKADGVTLVFSSTYRSYEYQVEVYARNVREDGQEAADRVSARPGHSQHQLGTVVDFGSIDNSFAQSAAGQWTAKNAGRFGFSLSFPQGAEEITGYSWESWHFRYIGKDAVALQDEFFGGIQQHMIVFLDALGRKPSRE